jgi:CBS domain-containing protein
MAKRVKDIMTTNPIAMPHSAPVAVAARAMRDAAIGDVIVLNGDRVFGIVTDRDIVVRGLAEGRDPARAKLGEICSRTLSTIAPAEDVDRAVQLMRDNAIRRLPVVENGRPVGIVSIGDLAVARARQSALATISGAPPNR